MAVDTAEMRELIKKLDVIAWREAIRELIDEVEELRAQLAYAKSIAREYYLQEPNTHD